MLPTTAPYQYFNDLDGLPLDEGSIYFGIANTNPVTNPIPLFWDFAGTQPAAQPIKTGAGYPLRFGTPSNVFTSSSEYSISVYDKKGRLVYTNPTSDDYNVLSILGDGAPGKGSSLIAYQLDSPGSVLQTVYSRLSVRVSAKDFGALGNGVADDTVALQAAINACIARGAQLDLLKGTYLHSGLSVNGALTIVGEGQDVTLLQCTSTTGTHISVDTTLSFRIEGVTFRTSGVATGGQTINLTSSTPGTANQHSFIKDCTFNDQFICIKTAAAYLWKIEGCTFNLYINTAVWVQNDYNPDAGDSTIYGGCVFAGQPTVNSVGIRQLSSGGLKLIGNKFVQGGYGYLMQLAHGANTADLLINGNSIEGQLVAGIQLNRESGGPTDMNFSSVEIVGNQLTSSPTGIPINLNDTDPGWLQGVVIDGNSIDIRHGGTPPNAILVNGANGFTITSNTIEGNVAAVAGISVAAAASNGVIGMNAIFGINLPISNNSTSTYVVKKVYQLVTAGITCNAAYGTLFSGNLAVPFPTGLFLQSPVVTATAVGGTGAVSAIVSGVNGIGCNISAIANVNGAVVTVHLRAEADF